MSLFGIFREVEVMTRSCTLCDADVLIVEDENGARLHLDAEPVEGIYVVSQRLLPRRHSADPEPAQVTKGLSCHTNHADTCPMKRKKK